MTFQGRRYALGMAAASVMVLAGCSTTTDYSGVELKSGLAELDPSSQTVTYPLDAYQLSASDDRTVRYAEDLLVRDCVEEKSSDADVEIVDRRKLGNETTVPSSFGLWDPERAARYGYSDPPMSDTMQNLLALNSSMPSNVQALWSSCLSSVDFASHGLDTSFLSSDTNLAARGYNEAVGQASATSEWSDVRERWIDCVSDEGLVPDEMTLAGIEGVAEMGSEQQIRAALVDVSCKKDVDFVQTLADIIGSYQMVYIEQNESALVEQQSRAKGVLDAAAVVISQHGG